MVREHLDGQELCISDLQEISKSQLADSGMAAMYLQDGTLPDDNKSAHRIALESKQFEVIDGVFYHENSPFPGRWCVVTPKQFHEALLEKSHQGHFAGHLASKKVYDRLRRHVWWKGMKNDASRFCKACQCVPLEKVVVGPFDLPWPQFQLVFAVDILQLPLTAQGNCYVAVFADYLTKWPEAYAIPDQKAETIAKLFVEKIVCCHGIPEELLSDRGANFLSGLIQEICRLLGVKKINTSGYHPHTDGLVEILLLSA